MDDLARVGPVVMAFVPSCGHCLPCAEGRPALCEPGAAANTAGTLLSGARRLSRDGAPVHHHLSGTPALDDINRGFGLLHEGRAVRQVVVFP